MQEALADGSQVRIAMGVLQGVATLGLIWIAGVRYLFHELGSLIGRGEAVPLDGGVADRVLGILILGVWMGGFLLFLMVDVALVGVAGFVLLERVMWVAFLLVLGALIWVVVMTLGMLRELYSEPLIWGSYVGLLLAIFGFSIFVLLSFVWSIGG